MCCDWHPEIPGVPNNTTGTLEQKKTNSWTPVSQATDKKAPAQTTKINSFMSGPSSDARPTGVQLNREAKLSCSGYLTVWTSRYNRAVKLVFVLKAKTKFSFSRVIHQFYVIRALALRTKFKHYRVVSCFPIFTQYSGMHLLPFHAVTCTKNYERQHYVKRG